MTRIASDRPTEGGLPPGPSSPAFAQTLSWMYRPIPFLERCRERYGPVFSVRLGPKRNTVVVSDPELARSIAAGDPAIFRAGDANGIMRPVVGPSSLLVLDGPEHLHHRGMMLPAFSATHGRAFAEHVGQITDARIGTWRQGEVIRLQDEMEAISFEAIMRVALGAEPAQRLDRFRALVPEMMERCGSPFTLLPYFRRELGGITPYARLRRVLDELDDLFYAAITERRAAPEGEGDVLSMLVRATDPDGAPLPDSDIRDELLTLIMAGYETTTSALAWCFERLMRNPPVLNRLLDELRNGDEAYLDAVVRETLRLRPVVPVIARKVREDVTLGAHTVPAGSVLMVSIYLLHSDPELFADPQEFRPERFLAGEHQEALWMPFGGGVRRCLGASFAQTEMKVVLRSVLGRTLLVPVDQADERVARRRFTFAPGAGARARVETLSARVSA